MTGIHRLVRRDFAPEVIAQGLVYGSPERGSDNVSDAGWQTGTASWYGGARWQGQRMSDGSRYDDHELTAAHRSLPLGSFVRVTLLDSARSVVVRITDRPGTRRRIIDLSRAAAAQLGMLSSGVASVRISPL